MNGNRRPDCDFTNAAAHSNRGDACGAVTNLQNFRRFGADPYRLDETGDAIGLQSMVAPPPRDAEGKRFYAEPDRVVARVAALKAMGFAWVALNATAVFQAGARSVDAMLDTLGALHARLRAEVG